MSSVQPQVQEFFDPATSTLSYIVYDPASKDAVVIDPVLDFDPPSGKITTTSVEKVRAWIKKEALKLHAILETHAHADHLSGAQVLKRFFPHTPIAIGAHITEVQEIFSKIFNLGPKVKTDGSQFDLLLREGVPFCAGTLEVQVLFTPGHTPACSSYLIRDALFSGDAIFMPDSGTGRCDFPRGSAETLYRSITEKLYRLPDSTRLFVGHDYQPGGRPLQFKTTIGEQKATNIQLKAKTTLPEFVQFRTARDATLTAPKLLLPSIQVNIQAGHLPEPEDNGVSYLKLPLRLA